MTQIITQDEVLEIFDINGISEFEFYNKIFNMIYKFFKKYEFGNTYVLENFKPNFKCNKSVVNVLNAFGIYFTKEDVKEPSINYVVLTLTDVNEIVFARSITAMQKFSNLNLKTTYLMVENDLETFSNAEKIMLLNFIHSRIENVHFMNKYLNVMDDFGLWKNQITRDVSFYKNSLHSKDTNVKFANIYSNIYNECIKGFELIDNAVNAKKLLKSLINTALRLRKNGKDIVYYYEVDPSVEFTSGKSNADVKNDMEQVYNCFASILTMKYGIRCIVPTSIKKAQNLKSSYLLARANMYVYDYFKLIDNFPDVTVHNNIEMQYYCILDREKLQKNYHNYIPKLTITAVPFDLEQKRFLSTKTVSVTYDKSLLNILDIRKYWSGITSDSRMEETATLETLNVLVKDFEKILKENSVSIHEILHQGNLILYEKDGEIFFGYLERVNLSLPFNVYPGDLSYSPFPLDLTNSTDEDINLESLQSIFIDVDYVNTLKSLANMGANFSVKRLYYRLPEYSDGIIFLNILYNYFNIQNFKNVDEFISNFASADELGIWCESARQFRKGSHYNDDSYYMKLKDLFNAYQLRKNNYLTFYGGLHPFISLKIALKPELF